MQWTRLRAFLVLANLVVSTAIVACVLSGQCMALFGHDKDLTCARDGQEQEEARLSEHDLARAVEAAKAEARSSETSELDTKAAAQLEEMVQAVAQAQAEVRRLAELLQASNARASAEKEATASAVAEAVEVLWAEGEVAKATSAAQLEAMQAVRPARCV